MAVLFTPTAIRTIIRNNFIADTEGDLESSHSWYPLGHGIWPEFLEEFKDTVIENNVSINNGGHGLFLTNNFHCQINNNIFFANQLSGARLGGHEKSKRAQGHSINNNVFASAKTPNPVYHMFPELILVP